MALVPTILTLALAGALGAPTPATAALGPGTDLSAALPPGFEASGAAWHPARDELLVLGDDGRLLALSSDGALRQQWTVPTDLEGLCVADPNAELVYAVREKPEAVLEFDLVTGSVTRVFDLVAVAGSPGPASLEAIAFDADPTEPEGGAFLLGSTHDGRLYRLRLPIRSSATSNQVTLLSSSVPAPSSGLRGLEVDAGTGVLYALYTDPAPVVRVLTTDGVPLASWPLVAPAQGTAEGLARRGCDLFVAADGQGAPSGFARLPQAASLSQCRTLEGDTQALSVFFGGGQELSLELGPAASGWPYLVLGSRRLGAPGLVAGPLVLPLELDDYLLLTLAGPAPPVFQGFTGLLDGAGRGTARLVLPPGNPVAASLVGQRLFHAAVALDPSSGWFAHASNAVGVRFAF